MTGLSLSSANLDPRRKRVLFRSWRRGTREMDLLLGRFADAHLPEMSDADLTIYEHLIDAPDRDLYAWISGKIETPSNYDTPIFQQIRAFNTHETPVNI